MLTVLSVYLTLLILLRMMGSSKAMLHELLGTCSRLKSGLDLSMIKASQRWFDRKRHSLATMVTLRHVATSLDLRLIHHVLPPGIVQVCFGLVRLDSVRGEAIRRITMRTFVLSVDRRVVRRASVTSIL